VHEALTRASVATSPPAADLETGLVPVAERPANGGGGGDQNSSGGSGGGFICDGGAGGTIARDPDASGSRRRAAAGAARRASVDRASTGRLSLGSVRSGGGSSSQHSPRSPRAEGSRRHATLSKHDQTQCQCNPKHAL